MQPYLMISNRNRDGDDLGGDLGTLQFFTPTRRPKRTR